MERELLKELDLSCGHVKIFRLYGRDARDVMRVMSGGGDGIEAMENVATRCVTVNDNNLTLSMLEDMYFEDYFALNREIDANFTRMVPKES